MSSLRIDRRHALALGGLGWLAAAGAAAAQHPAASHAAQAAGADAPPGLPPAVTTQHVLELPGRTLRFSATAGSIRPSGGHAKPLADIAFIAYQVEGTDRARRPVTFVFNGGPGFASAWLQLGAVGPWRIKLVQDGATFPSATPEPQPNADTWLDFTDLVFIDPAGTGYSQVLTTDDGEKRKLWSVEGDIDYLAETVRRWLDRYERTLSPKYILGESYGGFRAPRLARELASSQGTGIAGLLLASPALEMPGYDNAFDPFFYVGRLPSMTAAARALRGSVTRAQLADVEQYAATEYLVDVTRGESDPAAAARRSARVAAFTGLDPALVRRHGGLLGSDVFRHALYGDRDRVASAYDATISDLDPYPLATLSQAPDAVLDALKAPVSSAMVAVYETLLNWRPESVYRLGNSSVGRQWDWGRGIDRPQSIVALRNAMAVDSRLAILIGHGLYDLVTPYFATALMLDQIPASLAAGRLHFSTHPGGHMFYTQDASRAAWREQAVRLFQSA